MEYSAACDVLIVEAMYNLRSLTKHAGSVSCLVCLLLVTAITFVNIMVLGFGLGLCASNGHTVFLLMLHFRSLNIRINFNIILP